MDLYKLLQDLDIAYEEQDHEAVFTVAQAQALKARLSGCGCKNLLLTNKKHTAYFLAIMEAEAKADLKALSGLVGAGRLSFASPEELMDLMGLIPGSVSPFGLINDPEGRVGVLLSKELVGQRLIFHPNTNCKSLALSYEDFLKYLQAVGREPVFY